MPQRNAAIKITYRGRDTDRPNLRDWLQKVYNRVSMIAVNGAYGAINNPNIIYGIFAEEGTTEHTIFKVPSGRGGRKGWLRFPNPKNPGGMAWKRARKVMNSQDAQHFIQETLLSMRDQLRNDLKRAGLDQHAINVAINKNLKDLKAELEANTPEHVYYEDPAGWTEDRPKRVGRETIPEGHLRDNYHIVRARRRA